MQSLLLAAAGCNGMDDASAYARCGPASPSSCVQTGSIEAQTAAAVEQTSKLLLQFVCTQCSVAFQGLEVIGGPCAGFTFWQQACLLSNQPLDERHPKRWAAAFGLRFAF